MVVDEEERVTGIISLSDLLQYLVLRPQGEGGLGLRTVIEENAADNTANASVDSPNKENTDVSTSENAVENEVLPTVPDPNKISIVVEINTDPRNLPSVDIEECSEPLECEKSMSPDDESKSIVEIAEEVTDADGIIDSSTNDAEN